MSLKKELIGLTLLTLMFASMLFLGNVPSPVNASSSAAVSIINPGPDGAPAKWNASTTVRFLGTSDFIFYSNETSVNSRFFINVTVSEVERMRGWGIGIVYDNTTIQYVSDWRPSDHALKPVEDLGWTYFPTKSLDPVNATHAIIKLGYTYIIPEGESWSFNGTGRLCQVQFKIVKAVSETYPKAKSSFEFDPGWTTIYQYPSGTLTPILNNGRFEYSYPMVPKVPHLTFDPERVVDASLVPTSSFNMSLKVFNATDLYSWEAKIYYNNTILNATEVVEEGFLKSVGTTVFEFEIAQDYNSTHGQISMNCSLVGPEFGAFGDGDLAKITFEVLALGDTPITIVDDVLYDSSGAPITHTKKDGYFSNILLAKISIDPPEIRDPSLVPCTTFEVNVTIDDVENMKICVFNVTYNREVLLELYVLVPKVMGQYPSKKMIIDDEPGYIWINLTYPSAVTTYEPVVVARITFHVEALGVSPIDLEDTELQDPLGNPIGHEVYNGIFIGLIRDVAVTRIDVSVTVAYQEWLVYINVTVKNEGNMSETFDVSAKYDGNLINVTTVVSLSPDTETTLTFVWNTTGVPACHNYTISAEAQAVPYETDLLDNFLSDGTVKIKMQGDINGDGRVNMDDVNLVVSAFGAFPGHPRWNPDADLNQDGRISMADIILVLANFGKTC